MIAASMQYALTIALILALLLLGIGIDRLYRRFARRHPELGPFRNPNAGCGSCSGGKGCSGETCNTVPH